MKEIYLAFYKGKQLNLKMSFRYNYNVIIHYLTTFVTKGDYSHVELAVKNNDYYDCYTASFRDKGVRKKKMKLPSTTWELVPVEDFDYENIISYFNKTNGSKYDLIGAIALIAPFNNSKRKYFCSEWVWNALNKNSDNGWRFSPNHLYEIYRNKNNVS